MNFENYSFFGEAPFNNLDNLTLYNDSLSIFNFPISDVYRMISENTRGSYLGKTAQVIFTTIYVVLSVLGFLWNVLIVWVIIRKSELRTPRNWYIINLTISDVAMCLICMPFTLIGLLQKNWALGSVICKLIPAIQCGNILVSTATIVAIAADRYKTIISFGYQNQSKINVPCTVVLIWIASLIFTIPLFIFYSVERVMINGIFVYDKCREDWNPPVVKAVWTTCLLLIQYLIPIFVLGFFDVKINRFLKSNQSSQTDPRRLQREVERNKRTMTLLTSVALTFAISWLPWHVVNFLADFHYSGFKEPQYFYSVFGGCHVIAMSTACTNPILYGWLNTNLNKEISEMIRKTLHKLRCKRHGTQKLDSKQRRLLKQDFCLHNRPSSSKNSGPLSTNILSSSFSNTDGHTFEDSILADTPKQGEDIKSFDGVKMDVVTSSDYVSKNNYNEDKNSDGVNKYLLENNGSYLDNNNDDIT